MTLVPHDPQNIQTIADGIARPEDVGIIIGRLIFYPNPRGVIDSHSVFHRSVVDSAVVNSVRCRLTASLDDGHRAVGSRCRKHDRQKDNRDTEKEKHDQKTDSPGGGALLVCDSQILLFLN